MAIQIKLIEPFLSNRKNQVHISNTTSQKFAPEAEVLLRSILSPLLVNILLANIPIVKYVTQYLYADDFAVILIVKRSKAIFNVLTKHLASYSKYCRIW